MRKLPVAALASLLIPAACAPVAEDTQEPTRPPSGTVVSGDAELRWVREGQGPVLFVLGSSVFYPKSFSQTLRQHFELVFLDGRHFVPGYAPGAERLAELGLDTFADDVEAARVQLGYDRISLLGHSVHGQIALAYADRYPETTERVVLVGPVPYAFAEFSDATDALWQDLASSERKELMSARLATLDSVLAAAPPNRGFAAGYRHRGPLYWADPLYDAEWVLDGLEDGPAFGPLVGTLPGRDTVRARLERIDAPILLVLGKLDFAVPFTVWEELIEGVEGIEYVLMDDQSHNPQTEAPERFDAVLAEWMGRR